MRILHVIASASPAGGGPIEGIKQLTATALEKGHKVELASLDSPNAQHVHNYDVPIYPLGPGKLKYGFTPRLVPWLRENAKHYDAVIVNGIWQYHSFAVWRALGKSKTPYVVFTHGMLDPWFKRQYPLKHIKKWLYWPWGEYRVLRDASAVLFTCEEERMLARQSFSLYSAKERVVNYGTAAPKEDAVEQAEIFLRQFPNLRNKRIVLFIGRIHPKKGCDIAIKAFASALANDPQWHLVIAGPDQVGWRSALSSLAADLGITDRMTWTGMITGDSKTGLIRSSDVLFLPSHQENFGIVVAEALACGVPALISNKVNIWREVEFDGAGFVASDTLEGASCLLTSWKRLSNNQQLIMRERARACFKNRFEINQASKTLIQALEDVIHGQAGPLPKPPHTLVGPNQ